MGHLDISDIKMARVPILSGSKCHCSYHWRPEKDIGSDECATRSWVVTVTQHCRGCMCDQSDKRVEKCLEMICRGRTGS